MKRLLSVILCLILILSITPLALAEASPVQITPPVPPDNPIVYADVAERHWAHWYIDGLAKEGITLLANGNQFDPSTPMTRAGVVLGLAQVLGVEATSYTETGFTDVSPTEAYAPYIRWARDNGIVGGTTPTTFNPEGSITRQDIATILGRYAIEYDVDLPIVNSPRQFTDSDSIAEYAAIHVLWLQMAGIIGGYPDGSFNPRAPVSRAEVATMLWRFSGRPSAPAPPPVPLPFPNIVRPNITNINQSLTLPELNSYVLSFLPTDPEIIKTYIAESPQIDYKSDIIQNAAREISNSASTDYEKLRATYDYVIARMSYNYFTFDNAERASDALAKGFGVCNDYAIATLALLYAQGIPAAIASVLAVYPGEEWPDDLLSNHAIIVAFVDGYWRILEPTWGDSYGAADRFFDTPISVISETHFIRFVYPPGRSEGGVETRRTAIRFSMSPTKLIIDGHTVAEYQEILYNDEYYFNLQDLATGLSRYSKTSGKHYDSQVMRVTASSTLVCPNVKRPPSGAEFNYTLPTSRLWGHSSHHYVGIGGVAKEFPAILIDDAAYDSAVFVERSAMHALCAELDISIVIDGNTVTIDTARPYAAP